MAIGGDPFRRLGVLGQSLGSILTKQRAGPREPIIAILHLACPRIQYLDRGKSSVNLPGPPANAIADLIEGVTEKWAKQRRAEERDRSARARRADRLIRRERPTSIKDAAASVMEQAYMAASANGTLPANPRQVMYCARPKILAITGRGNVDSQYFTQALLVDYVNEHPEECFGWDVVWDDRGHFVEPHTGRRIGLGTLAVRRYIAGYARPILCKAGFADASVATYGPEGRYGALLYIEKEGFLPILEAARLAEKFDLAIMSCKGMSTTAARLLADRTCQRFEIPLLVLHDFDVAGFSIAGTLSADTRRYAFRSEFKVIDLGLRLDDVRALELESEPVALSADKEKLANTLRRHGATEDEIAFLMEGQRVELNAMTSDQFIAFVESKLTEAGIAKVVPPKARLDDAYRLFARSKRVKTVVEEAIGAIAGAEISVPNDLSDQVRAYLAEHPDEPWERAVRHVAADFDVESEK